MEVLGIVLVALGLIIAVFSKFIIFKSFERQIRNINLQYEDMKQAEDEKNEKNIEESEIDEDFLQIVRVVKFVTYGISAAIAGVGLLIILVFRIYI